MSYDNNGRDRNGMTYEEGYALGTVIGTAVFNPKLENFLMTFGMMIRRRKLNEARRESYKRKKLIAADTPTKEQTE